MKQREAAYDNLKFLLIFLVALLHGADFYTESSGAFRSVYIFIYPFVMPAFVFVSGLFAKSALAQGRRALKRAGYFLVLYVLCKILLTIPSMILSGAAFDLFRESGIPWFMLSMASWYALTPLLLPLPVPLVLGASLFLGCTAGYIGAIGDFLCLSKTIVFYPFFLAGCYLDPQKLLEKTRAFWPRAAGVCGFLLLGCLAVFWRGPFYSLRPLFSARESFYALPQPEYGALLRLLHYLAALCLICGLIAWIPRRHLPHISVWGGRTLQVYFLHYIFLYPLKWVPALQQLPAAGGVLTLPAAGGVLALSAAGGVLALAAVCAAVVCLLSARWFSYPFVWLQRLLLERSK